MKNIQYPISNIKFPIIFFLVISLTIFASTYHPASAQEASKSAQEASESSRTATSSAQTNPIDTVQEKINSIKNQIASKAATLKFEVNKKLSNKAFVGTVLQKDGSRLTIKTKNGDRQIETNEYTSYENHKLKKAIKEKDIEEGDTVASLGEIDDKNVLIAKKIVYLENQKLRDQSPKMILGEITNVTPLVIKTKDQNLALVLNPNAKILFGNKELINSDLSNGMRLVAVGKEIRSSLPVDFIYILGSTGIGSNESSPSAKPD